VTGGSDAAVSWTKGLPMDDVWLGGECCIDTEFSLRGRGDGVSDVDDSAAASDHDITLIVNHVTKQCFTAPTSDNKCSTTIQNKKQTQTT